MSGELALDVKDALGAALTSKSVVLLFKDKVRRDKACESYLANVSKVGNEYVFVGEGQKEVPITANVDFLIVGTKYKLQKAGD